jgi:hypothetical protein
MTFISRGLAGAVTPARPIRSQASFVACGVTGKVARLTRDSSAPDRSHTFAYPLRIQADPNSGCRRMDRGPAE